MFEVKVQCDCGQRYKFDVEPVQGRMPFTINCPHCGLDGTEKANAILAGLPETELRPAPAPSTAFPPPEQRYATVASSAGAAPHLVERTGPPVPQSTPSVAASAAHTSAPTGNLPLGLVGAVVAGFIGMLAWYFLIKLTGYQIGYAAWGVGFVVGFGARLLGRQGSQTLGIAAATCAFLAILGGQYLCGKVEADKAIAEIVTKAYESRMEYAKEAAQAQSDAQIKALLVKYEENSSPTDKDIKEFKDVTQARLKEFAESKDGKNRFEQRSRQVRQSFSYNFMILKESVGLFTIIFLLLGVSTAYKLGAG